MSEMDRALEADGDKLRQLTGEDHGPFVLNEWPKITKIYLHGDKETNWDIGERLGLSGEAIGEVFRGCCYEVDLTISVNEDGSAVITHIADQPLAVPIKAT